MKKYHSDYKTNIYVIKPIIVRIIQIIKSLFTLVHGFAIRVSRWTKCLVLNSPYPSAQSRCLEFLNSQGDNGCAWSNCSWTNVGLRPEFASRKRLNIHIYICIIIYIYIYICVSLEYYSRWISGCCSKLWTRTTWWCAAMSRLVGNYDWVLQRLKLSCWTKLFD